MTAASVSSFGKYLDMRYAELPSHVKSRLRDAQPGFFEYRPPSDHRSKSRTDYVLLEDTLPHGVLNAQWPASPTRYVSRLYAEISGGKGFDRLNDEVIYRPFDDDLSPDPNYPVSREPSFYHNRHFQCWAADERALPVLDSFGIVLPKFSKRVFELTRDGNELPIACLLDFPAADVIDYDASVATWSVCNAPAGQPNTRENFIYLPSVAPRAVPTILKSGEFGAPIVRERHALTNIFVERRILERLQELGIQGPDYSVLTEPAWT